MIKYFFRWIYERLWSLCMRGTAENHGMFSYQVSYNCPNCKEEFFTNIKQQRMMQRGGRSKIRCDCLEFYFLSHNKKGQIEFSDYDGKPLIYENSI